MSTLPRASTTGTDCEAGGEVTTQALGAIRNLELQLRRLRRQLETHATRRDLLSEIECLLEIRSGLTTPEVAQAITSRESSVRRTLKENPERFSVRTGLPGRSPLARCWILVPTAARTQPCSSADSLEVTGG